MKTTHAQTVTVDVASRLEMLEMVQTVLAHLSTLMAFDEYAAHYMSVAVRESVVYALNRGKKREEAQRVGIDVTMHPDALEIQVKDEGGGFDPVLMPKPVAEENLLKAYGRGIFFRRS